MNYEAYHKRICLARLFILIGGLNMKLAIKGSKALQQKQVIKTPRLKVQVWIYGRATEQDELRYLILQTTTARGSFWQPVTGSVELNESIENAAAREAHEETGLQFQGPVEKLDYSFEYESRGERLIEYGFCAAVKIDLNKPLPLVQLDGREHVAYEWVLASVARQRLKFDSNIEMLGRLLAKLGAT